MKNNPFKTGRYALILQNASYLTAFEIMRMIMPFIAMPYLIRTVGREHYGAVVVAQAIVAFASLLVNFGLDISAVKDIARCRHDPRRTDETVSSVMIIKTTLLLLALAILTLLTHTLPYLHRMAPLLLAAFPVCIADVLIPVWYYQGKENMKPLTLIRFCSIAFYTLTIFIFIRTPDDYPRIPLLQSAGMILSGLISLYCLLAKDKIHLCLPPLADIRRKLIDSAPFFLSRASLAINSQTAKIVCDLFLTRADVTAFDVAQKICNGGMIPMQMFNQALYPNLSKSQDKNLLRRSFGLTTLVTTLVAAAILALSGIATDLLSAGKTPQAAGILQILTLYIFLSGYSVFLGTSTLVAFGHQRPFNLSVILSTLVIILCYTTMITTHNNSIHLYAWTLVLAELTLTACRFHYSRRHQLLHLRDAIPQIHP
jgi:PST family polysaccharide transporter